MSPRPAESSSCYSRSTKLYDLLGINCSCSSAEITRAYRLRALQLHPDKNKEEDAHNRFIQLQQAYSILKDEKKRKRYDTTGCEEEESADFEKAYEWFRCNAPKVEAEDIESFRKEYRDSEMEEEDLMNFYQKFDGEVGLLLEYIPYSEPEDVDRFLKIFQKLFKKKTLKETDNFAPSIDVLRKNAGKYKKKLEKERKEWQKLQKDNNQDKQPSLHSLADLASAIQSNVAKRSSAGSGFLDGLEDKYKSKAKKVKEQSPPTEEEFQATQKRVDFRAKKPGTSNSRKRPNDGAVEAHGSPTSGGRSKKK
eukprot:GHVS01051255.1.p1 GENE.GHVS01051255.1~~GHVS01051255.1.p1  ORF type:complete len:351 (+),score=79.49 GHVS01051255.1:130-1053(+)